MKNSSLSQDFDLFHCIYEKGLDEALEDGAIGNLTLHGKCYVIRSLAAALRDKIHQKTRL
ncbi:MAG: hypothetical protein COB36_11155 [Alphaproteobacteria bacterium]|nr:MAG: hypothetical protein COB36_11155 [Alphaproteobacteria bacterium]